MQKTKISPSGLSTAYQGRTRILLGVGTALVAAASHWPLRMLDLDFHHDGYVVGVAVAVAQGQTPHTDIFLQYGPLFTFVQSVAVLAGGNAAVLALRSLSVLLIAIIAGLLALSGSSRAEGQWPIPAVAGPIAAVIWILLSDAFTWVPILPWVSLWVTATILLVLNLVRVSYETSNPTLGRWALVGSGLATSSLLMSRPATGLTALGLLAIAATRSNFRESLGPFLWSVLVSVAGLGVIAATTNWGSQFFWHVYGWPVQNYAVGGFTLNSLVALYLAASRLWPELVCLAILAARGRLQFTADQKMLALGVLALFKTASLDTLLAQVVSVGVVVVLLSIPEVHRIRRGHRLASNAISGILAVWILVALPVLAGGINLRASPQKGMDFDPFSRAFSSVSTNMLYLALFAGLAVCIAVCISTLLQDTLSRAAPAKLLIAIFGLASAGELLSVPDTRHVWWTLPPSLILLVSSVIANKVAAVRPESVARIVAVLTLFMVSAAVSAFAYANVGRIDIDDGVAKGMRVERGIERRYREALQLVRSLDGEERAMYVGDLLVSVIDGYYWDSPIVVEWGPDAEFEDLLEFNRIVVETPLVQKPRVARGLAASGFVMEFEQGGYTVFRR